MFSHIMVGSNDIARSKTFYDAIFAASGAEPGKAMPNGAIAYQHKGNRLMIIRPIDGQPATHANGGTIGLTMDTPEQAAAWHAAGSENGGTPVEDPPGWRQGSSGRLYLAYLRDPDGNKLCATYREPA